MQSHGEYTVVEKHTFGSPELLSTVPAWAPPIIEEIVMVGFATDICVIMNALLLKNLFPRNTHYSRCFLLRWHHRGKAYRCPGSHAQLSD